MDKDLDWKKGPRCGYENCPSTKYAQYSDGLTYCKEGHQQAVCSDGHRRKGQWLIRLQGQIATQPDEEDFAIGGRRYRQQKEVKEQVSRSRLFFSLSIYFLWSEPDHISVYRGSEALQLYLQAYQLILRKQCWTLIHTLGLPAELEVVVKDLWELRIQLLKDRLEKGADAEAVFSSQQQSETEGGKDQQKRKKWEARGKETPSVLESLGLIYMAIVILRLPVSMGDLHRYSQRIPTARKTVLISAFRKLAGPSEKTSRSLE